MTIVRLDSGVQHKCYVVRHGSRVPVGQLTIQYVYADATDRALYVYGSSRRLLLQKAVGVPCSIGHLMAQCRMISPRA